MKSSLEEIIRYREERCFETLAEAKILMASGKFSGTINRIYYACFYIVSALL